MADTLIRLRDDTPSAAPVVPLAELGDHTNATAVGLSPGDDARALLPLLHQIDLVEVAFPAYTDGRGYSQARFLREHGYTGELRATDTPGGGLTMTVLLRSDSVLAAH